MLEEHDHRLLGSALDLFHFQEEAPGMVFWHPRGLAVYRALEAAARRQVVMQGYGEVRTPQLMRRPIWEASGHWQNFRDDMFTLECDALPAAMKPVSCPGHIHLFKGALRSYRDLPLRFAEMGCVHRNERSGTLHGLFRLRQFTQDDGHVFCAREQALQEIVRFCRGLVAFYEALGFAAPKVGLSTRPEVHDGKPEDWSWAEELLGAAASAAGLSFTLQPGSGAFYGPKLEFVLQDRLGRDWQCGTIQLDVVLPERFDIDYVDAGGVRARPVILHRAIYGSLERFMGVLLEHHKGVLPAWLAAEQVWVVGLGEAAESARRAVVELEAAGIRCKLDALDDSLGRKVARAHALAVPYLVIIGNREAAQGTWSLRERGGASRSLAVPEALELMRSRCAVV